MLRTDTGKRIRTVLFILFTNDLDLLKQQQLKPKTEEFIDSVRNWFSTNPLSLNQEKTNVLLFRTKLSKAVKLDTVKAGGKLGYYWKKRQITRYFC